MEERFIYTSISEKVLKNARTRVQKRLSQLTSGRIDEVVELVEEYKTLNTLCDEVEEKYKKMEQQAEPEPPFGYGK